MNRQIDWDRMLRIEHYTNVDDLAEYYRSGYIFLYQAIIGYLIARLKGPMTKDCVNNQLCDSQAYIADRLGFKEKDYKKVYDACSYLRKLRICWQESSPTIITKADNTTYKAYRWLFGLGNGNVADMAYLCRTIVKEKDDNLKLSDKGFSRKVSEPHSERIRQNTRTPSDKTLGYAPTSKNEVQPTRQAKNGVSDKRHIYSYNIPLNNIDEEGPRENAVPEHFKEEKSKQLEEITDWMGN